LSNQAERPNKMFPISHRHFAMPLVPLAIVIRAAYGRANFLVFEGVAKTHPGSILRLATLRSHNQYNTTIYGWDDC
jgi:hypothetical protein